MAIMLFFEHMVRSHEDVTREARIELTSLHANFRYLSALGEKIELEAQRMLKTFTAQLSTQKRGLLGSEKDAIKRQSRMLDEIEHRFVSASNFFIQDRQFERCLDCLRQLQLIGVQKKTVSFRVVGLAKDQVVGTMCSLDSASDVLAVGYGYALTSIEEWANVLYRQVVVSGRKEVFTLYLDATVSRPPELLAILSRIHAAENSNSSKENASRQVSFTWLVEQLGRGNSS
jgi:hypothetical protein